jgi:hypothetical protein
MDVDEMTSERAACLGALCAQMRTTIHDATRRDTNHGLACVLICEKKKDVEKKLMRSSSRLGGMYKILL